MDVYLSTTTVPTSIYPVSNSADVEISAVDADVILSKFHSPQPLFGSPIVTTRTVPYLYTFPRLAAPFPNLHSVMTGSVHKIRIYLKVYRNPTASPRAHPSWTEDGLIDVAVDSGNM